MIHTPVMIGWIQLIVFIIVINNTFLINAQQCSQRGYCGGVNCPNKNATSTDGVHILDFNLDLLLNVNKAVKIMRTYPGVYTSDGLYVHTTFQYLCCVTKDELKNKVFPALDSIKWEPISLEYEKVICNQDGSIILIANNHTQIAMGQLLKNFEAAIIKAGVPIVRPRAEQEIFHITIGTTNSTYPMDIALNDINKNIKVWSKPIVVNSFTYFIPAFHHVVSHS